MAAPQEYSKPLEIAPPRSPLEEHILFQSFPYMAHGATLVPLIFEDDQIPNVVAHPSFQKQSEDFILRVWTSVNLLDRYIMSRDPRSVNGSMPPDSTEEHITDQMHRFTKNFNATANLLVEAFNGSHRRTGEPTAIHSLRIFTDLLSERLPNADNEEWIVKSTLLSSLMHDMDEDLTDFKFEAIDEWEGTYRISCKGVDGKSRSATLYLMPKEAQLVHMQMAAFTKSKTETPTDAEAATAQFARLNAWTLAIDQQFGPLASFYTLLVKWKDRFDNVCTYWNWNADEKRTVDGEQRRKKIEESIDHFTYFEKLALIFLDEWAQNGNDQITFEGKMGAVEEAKKYFDSIVEFCKKIQGGLTYEELLMKSVKKLRAEQREIMQNENLEKRRSELLQLYSNHPVLIPTSQMSQKQLTCSSFRILLFPT